MQWTRWSTDWECRRSYWTIWDKMMRFSRNGSRMTALGCREEREKRETPRPNVGWNYLIIINVANVFLNCTHGMLMTDGRWKPTDVDGWWWMVSRTKVDRTLRRHGSVDNGRSQVVWLLGGLASCVVGGSIGKSTFVSIWRVSTVQIDFLYLSLPSYSNFLCLRWPFTCTRNPKTLSIPSSSALYHSTP